MGEYLYNKLSLAQIYQILSDVKLKSNAKGIGKESKVKLNVFSMLIRDYIEGKYTECSVDLFYASLGALNYFLHPLNDIPDYLPLIGYQDDLFVTLCVFAGNRESIDAFKSWRVSKTKEELLQESLKNSDVIWENLCDKGYSIKLGDKLEILIQQSFDKINNSSSTDTTMLNGIRDITELVYNYNEGRYCTNNNRAVNGLIGTVGYWVMQRDMIPDNLSLMGYIDDAVAIECCKSKCSELLEDFNKWKSLYELYTENDPLEEYLNTVIGKDMNLRKAECARLAKLCKDSSLLTTEERARDALKNIL